MDPGPLAGRARRAAAVVSALRPAHARARRAADVAVLPRDLDPEQLPDLLHVLPPTADRRRRGPVRSAAGRARRPDRGPRPPPGRGPALGRRRAAREAGGAVHAAADRDADRVRGDHARHERLQRRHGRRARRLPRGVRGVIAFITGAAHGQGRATALALAEDGYDIVALDVAKPLSYPSYRMGSGDELDSLRDEVPTRCLTFVADVRDDEAVKAAVAEAKEHFG